SLALAFQSRPPPSILTMSATIVILASLGLLALVSASSSLVDVNDYDAAVAAEGSALAALEAASAWRAAARGGRGRRELENDEPFRLCGADLLLSTGKICASCPGKTKRSADQSFSRTRRASVFPKISNMCCRDRCRPSEVRSICCNA
ncbi:hypothetical protein PMAYCL1PPCAC_08574, partial [Pristionchus mayeri]